MTQAKNNPRTGLLKKWIIGINFSFILLLLLTYLTPYVSVEKWGWLSLLALTYPFIMLVNGLFALGWLFFRSWYAFISFLVIMVGSGHHVRYVKLFSTSGKQADCGESIRLISYNMRGLSLVPVQKGQALKVKLIHSTMP